MTSQIDKIVGASKQANPTADAPANIELKMAERIERGKSNARNNSMPKRASGAAQIKPYAHKRMALDPQEEVSILRAMLTDSEIELENVTTEHRQLRSKWKKLSDERDGQDDARKDCEAQRDFHIGIMQNILTHYVSPYASQYHMMPERWTDQDIYRVMRNLSRDAHEAASLRAQIDGLNKEVNTLQHEVRALQIDMLSKVEKIKAVSDEEFAQDFRNIVSTVKTLSREVRFTNQQDSLDTIASGTLLIGVSRNQWENRANKKSLTEAWFWSILIDKVFRSPFAILGERCDILSDVWQKLFGAQHCHGWPSPTILSETWRYTTIDQMLEKTEQGIGETGKMRPQYKDLEEDIVSIRNSIVQALQSGLSAESSEKNLPVMMKLIEKAFALMSRMVFQRARFQVTYPQVGTAFDQRIMMPLSSPEGDCTTGGIVSFVVNPGLTKWGDAHGANLDEQYDIVPALVNVKPTGPVQDASSR